MVRALDFALCLSPGKLGSLCGVTTQHPVVQRVDNTMLWTGHCHGQVLAKQTTLSTRKCVTQCVVSSMLKTRPGKCIYPPMQGVQLCMMYLQLKTYPQTEDLFLWSDVVPNFRSQVFTPWGDSPYKKDRGAYHILQGLKKSSFASSQGVQPQKVHSRSFCSTF